MIIWNGLLDRVVELQKENRKPIAFGFTIRWFFIGIVFFKHVKEKEAEGNFRTVSSFLWNTLAIAGETHWLWWYSWREELIDGEWEPVWWLEKKNNKYGK